MDAGAFELGTQGSASQWVVYTTGFRSLQPPQNHFVAVHNHDASGWTLLGKADVPCGDTIGKDGVRPVPVEPEGVWLQVLAGVGAHGGCFNLLRFDGQKLTVQASNQWQNADAGFVQDINGDKLGEVILNQTDYYVFCYACGMRYFQYSVLRWDGSKLAAVKLETLSDTAPAYLRRLNNQAVTLAQAGLWKDAQVAIAQADALKSADQAVRWNAALIKLTGDQFAKQAGNGPFPLLGTVFYGDYTAALDVMRPYTPEQLFTVPSSIISGTVAVGWEPSVTHWITETTTTALAAQPDLAAAYFVRGWGLNLLHSGSAEALADVAKAAQLAPNETLFSQSLAYLRKK